VEDNVSFTVLDLAAPVILAVSPEGEVAGPSVTVSVTTNEAAECRMSSADKSFAEMEFAMSGTGTSHSYALTGQSDGSQTFYILCNDSSGNLMSSARQLAFTVKSSVSGSGGAKPVSFKSSSIKAGAEQEISVTEGAVVAIVVTLTEDASDAGFRVSRIADASNVKRPDDFIVYEYVEISRENILADRISKATVRFRVPKSWIDANRIDTDKIYLLRYTSQWDQLSTRLISSDASGSLFEADTPGFSVFSIAGLQLPAPPSEENPESQLEDTDEEEGSGYLFYIILACVVVVGGGSAYYYVRSHRHPQQDSYAESQIHQTQSSEAAAGSTPAAAPQDQIDEYILQCHQAHMHHEEITKTLVEAGHDSAEIGLRMSRLGVLYDAASDPEVLQYIQDSLSGGMSEAEVRKELINVGHREDEVDRMFQALTPAGAQGPRDDLADYIASSLQAGISKEEIALNLVNAGFSEKDVERKIIEIDAAGSPPEEQQGELAEFIQLSLGRGSSKEDIRDSLIQMGMDPAQVDAALQRF
jgi:PGF-pre-PGF domain-containing protein